MAKDLKDLRDEDGNKLGYVPTDEELDYYVNLDLPGDEVLDGKEAE